MPELDFRMSVLHVDRDTDLPLAWTYERDERVFRTLGHVRMHGLMVFPDAFPGDDTAVDRDRFLVSVLTLLLLPESRARAIVRSADHLHDAPPPVDRSSPRAELARDPELERHRDRRRRLGLDGALLDGSFLAPWALALGAVLGAVAGGLLAGANGAVIAAFVGASTLPDLAMALWQIRTNDVGDTEIDVHDSWATAMVALGAVAGALAGDLLAPDGLRAVGTFVGMAGAAFVLAGVATRFSMVPFRRRAPAGFGPLVVGACAGPAYLLWSSPVSLAIGIVVGSLVAGVPARALASEAQRRAR